jgi:hypothetical protein
MMRGARCPAHLWLSAVVLSNPLSTCRDPTGHGTTKSAQANTRGTTTGTGDCAADYAAVNGLLSSRKPEISMERSSGMMVLRIPDCLLLAIRAATSAHLIPSWSTAATATVTVTVEAYAAVKITHRRHDILRHSIHPSCCD